MTIEITELEERAHTGPFMALKDFQKKMYLRARELVKEYDINRDPNDIVPTDISITKDIYEAALQLLQDVGFICVETSRTVQVEKDEILRGLRKVPTEVQFGSNNEIVRIKRRELFSQSPIVKWLGPWGAQISSPEMFLLIHQSYAKENIDALQCGVVSKIDGKTVRNKCVSEIISATLGAKLLREAVKRVGRPDMPISFDCVGGSDVAFPAIFTPDGARPTDHVVLFNVMSEMSFSLMDLNKIALAKAFNESYPFLGFLQNPYGGFGGGSETLAIISTAEAIFTLAISGIWGVYTGVTTISPIPKHEDLLWFEICNKLTLKKHTDAIICGSPVSFSEPSTETLVHELVYRTIPLTLTSDALLAAQAACGKPYDYVTGMEARIVSEVTDAVLGMGIKIEDANELCKEILKRYLKDKAPEKGKRFYECYDTEKIEPSKEYLSIYEKLKREYQDIGIEWI